MTGVAASRAKALYTVALTFICCVIVAGSDAKIVSAPRQFKSTRVVRRRPSVGWKENG